jgi:hypothetical protein
MAWQNIEIDQLIIADPPTRDQDDSDGPISARGRYRHRSGALPDAEPDATSAPRRLRRARASSKAATAAVRTAAAARAAHEPYVPPRD